MVTLPSEAADTLPHVLSFRPQDLRRDGVQILSRALHVRKSKAEDLLTAMIASGILERAFDGLHFAVEVVELHRHLPERSDSCTLGYDFTTIPLSGEASIKCERIWRPDVDPKQIKDLQKILKVYAKDRPKSKSVEIAKSLRQEDIDALANAYTAAVRGIEPTFQASRGCRDAISKALPQLLARRIGPKRFKDYVLFVFETFQRITGQAITPVRLLASDWYINAFKNDLGIVERMDTLNAYRLLRERGYKGPGIDVPVHMCERMLEGVSADAFVGPGFKPEMREAARLASSRLQPAVVGFVSSVRATFAST